VGKYIFQFNGDNPIQEQVNMVYSLLLRQNFMKLYEQQFLKAFYSHRVNDAFTYRTNVNYAFRRELENNSDVSLWNRPERVYTPNRPENIEADPMAFENHHALIWSNNVEWRPD
jgi:hypothetical protein